MMLVEVALLVVLCFLQVVFGIRDNLLDVLSEVNCIRHPTLVTHNNINRQSNLLSINQIKWRVACALSQN